MLACGELRDTKQLLRCSSLRCTARPIIARKPGAETIQPWQQHPLGDVGLRHEREQCELVYDSLVKGWRLEKRHKRRIGEALEGWQRLRPTAEHLSGEHARAFIAQNGLELVGQELNALHIIDAQHLQQNFPSLSSLRDDNG